jgi:hypothetical protein
VSSHHIGKIVEKAGFEPIRRPGFVSWRRTHDDGRPQTLSVFTWSNAKIAAEHDIPRSYLVVCLSLDSEHEEYRLRLPIVEWPSVEQRPRKTADIQQEFVEVFLGALNAPLDEGRSLLASVERRNVLE